MTSEKTKTFLIGIVGGIVGVVLVIGAIFSFFFVMNKIHTISITCLPQKEVEKRGVSCEILEIKDKGNILKTSEIISPPVNEEELKRVKDITTSGKFIEVRLKIKNNREETLNSSLTFFIDQEGRKFSVPYGPIRYWLPEGENFSLSIIPGAEKEIAEIFEVSKNSELTKLKIKLFLPSRLLD